MKLIGAVFAFIGFSFTLFTVCMPVGIMVDDLDPNRVKVMMIVLGLISAANFAGYFGISKAKLYGRYLGLALSFVGATAFVYQGVAVVARGGPENQPLACFFVGAAFISAFVYLLTPRAAQYFKK